jgi:hypothetical protein
MPSSIRYDKAARKEWIQAAEDNRSSQYSLERTQAVQRGDLQHGALEKVKK